MNLGSFFTVQHAVRTSCINVSLSFYTSSFPMFWLFPLHSSRTGQLVSIAICWTRWWISITCCASCTYEKRSMCWCRPSRSSHQVLQRTSAYTWTHTHSQLFHLSRACVCVFIHRSPRRDTSQCDRPQPGNNSSHPEDLHRDQAVRAK